MELRSTIFVYAVLVFAGVNVAATEIYDGFETGVIDKQLWQIDSTGQCEIELTTERQRQGKYSVAFVASGGARCELVPHTAHGFLAKLKRKFRREPFHQERWYRFSTYLEGPWVGTDKNVVLAQWHSSPDPYFDVPGRGPPLALRVVGDYFRISYGSDSKFSSSNAPIAIQTLWYGPIDVGRWVDWEFRVKWSSENDGEIQVWKNGTELVHLDGPNTYNDLRGVYLKLGVYHPGLAREVYFDEISLTDGENR